MKKYGYWDTEPSGELYGLLGQNKFTFVIDKATPGFSMNAYRENTQSGRETRASKFCASGLSKTALDQLQRSDSRAVVDGEI